MCDCVLNACTEYTVEDESCDGGSEILNVVDPLPSPDRPGPGALILLGQFIMKQSYITALIMMMVT